MRVGSTVLLKDRTSIQSYSWDTFRPLGKLQTVLDSLEEYNCDEIAIIRPVRDNDSFTDYINDIKVLRDLRSMTPISFGGGIRTLEHLSMLKDLPIERLILSSPFINKSKELITTGIELFGHQAIQCLLPLKYIDEKLCVYNPAKSIYIPFTDLDVTFINEFANEIILLDMSHEGLNDKFNWELVEDTGFSNDKLIITGGVGKKVIDLAKKNEVASVLIDNKTLHQEYSILSYENV